MENKIMLLFAKADQINCKSTQKEKNPLSGEKVKMKSQVRKQARESEIETLN